MPSAIAPMIGPPTGVVPINRIVCKANTRPCTRGSARSWTMAVVRRRPDPADGRAVRLELTPRGRAAIDRLRSAREAFLAKGLATLTADERLVVSEAVRLLGRLLEGA